ncbi:MAG: 50S ribosomal protein L17, partial [Bacteroidales bacterium]
ILKTGFRQGDNAEMCIIEFVDYNETYTTGETKKKAVKTRRSKKAATKAEEIAPVVVEEATPAETPIEEVKE